MRNKPDHPPRSENDPPHPPGAETPETDLRKPWSGLSSDKQELELEKFFGKWEPAAPDFANCLSEAELRKAVVDRNRSEWASHIEKCENCRSLAELLEKPDRVRIPVSKILAEASRRAWAVEHSAPKRSFTVRHVTALFNSIPQPQRRPIFVGAAIVLAVILGWIGYQYLSSEKPKATVAFENRPTPAPRETYADATNWFDRANEILDAGNYTVEAKVLSLEPLQSSKPKVEVTFNEANLDGSQRAKAGTLVTKYNSQLTVLKKKSPGAQNLDTVPPTVDSEIVSKVFFAFGSTDAPVVFNREGSEAAETILEAAKFTEVETIEPKSDQKTIVKIKIPQDFFGPRDLERRLESLKTQGLEVVVAAYSPPRGPKSKLKAINR